MPEKIKISKIEVKTSDGKKVDLTLEEAKELYEQLDKLFGDKTVYVPNSPLVIYKDRWPYYPVTWSDSMLVCKSSETDMKVTYSS